MLGRTTNYRRTIATLQGVLTGLYPEAQQHVVSVQTAPDVDEILFGRTDSCDRLRNMMKAQARALKGANSLTLLTEFCAATTNQTAWEHMSGCGSASIYQ